MANNNKTELLKSVDHKFERVGLAEGRDMLYELFRSNVRILRASSGISGCDFGTVTGLKNGRRILDLEYGRGNPSLEELISIAEYFKVTIHDLMHKKAVVILETVEKEENKISPPIPQRYA